MMRTLLPAACILLCLLLCSGCLDSSATVSIEGQVSADDGCGTGPVYVVALPEEHADRYRFVETETPVRAAPEVAGYTRIDGPGTYRIGGLAPGTYTVYAWQDKNDNGGIEHAGYAEPTGWYQRRDHLGPVAVDAAGGAAGIDITLISPHPYPAGERRVVRGDGGGSIRQIRNRTVLHLWGTARERAYAFGYLTGPQTMDFLEYVVIEHFAGSAGWYEDRFLPYLRSNFSAYRQYDAEAEAFIAGMRDAGCDMEIRWLNRSFTADDLYAITSYYFLENMRGIPPQGTRPACSSAVAWGNLTANPELHGGVIHGKNMDGENDLRKVTVNSLLVIAIEPPAGSGAMRVVDVGWPGFLGTFNPMNSAGIYLAPHAAASVPDYAAADHIDYPCVYREVALHASSTDEALDLWHGIDATLSGGFNTAISQPVTTGSRYPPSVTLESDAFGDEIRFPGEIWPHNPDLIFTTNTFFAYEGVCREAVAATGAYHDAVSPTDYRYTDMARLAEAFIADGGTIGTPEMVALLQAASSSEEYRGQTEYSFIAYPDQMAFALAREDLERKILDAPFARYERFGFDEVFGSDR
ncbi:MAG: hypothetical protein ACP5C4_04320 [Methanomicrobiales archaeon]